MVPVPGHASWSPVTSWREELQDQPLLTAALHQAHDLPQALLAGPTCPISDGWWWPVRCI
jgi:hypothetical protein